MQTVVETKSVLASKMVWLNLVTLAAGIAGYVAGAEVMQDYASVVAIAVAVKGALNIVLRFLTTQPIN